MSELQKLVIPLVDDRWFDYGVHLEIKSTRLNSIKGNHGGGGSKEAMRRVINHWLKSNTVVCWERIVSALETIDEINLSEEIGKKHVIS